MIGEVEVGGGVEPVVVMLGSGTTEALADALACVPGDAVGMVTGAAGFVEAGGGAVALAAESASGLEVLALRSPPEDMAGSFEPVPPMMCAGGEPVKSFFPLCVLWVQWIVSSNSLGAGRREEEEEWGIGVFL